MDFTSEELERFIAIIDQRIDKRLSQSGFVKNTPAIIKARYYSGGDEGEFTYDVYLPPIPYDGDGAIIENDAEVVSLRKNRSSSLDIQGATPVYGLSVGDSVMLTVKGKGLTNSWISAKY